GRAPDHAENLAGDLLLPGLVELHTDHLEAHYVPRPKVHWDPVAAVVSYDGQLATCGITTALDSLRVWREDGAEDVDGEAEILADALAIARVAALLRLEHFLHLRCEVPMPSVVAETKALIDRPDVRLVSLMDHTPGQRQFRDEGKLRDYYRGKSGGKTDAELDVLFAKRIAYQAAHAETNHRGRRGARRVPDHGGSGAGAARSRRSGLDGGAQSRPRRLACRQHRDAGAGARRRARRALVGLRTGEPADGGVASAPGRCRYR